MMLFITPQLSKGSLCFFLLAHIFLLLLMQGFRMVQEDIS